MIYAEVANKQGEASREIDVAWPVQREETEVAARFDDAWQATTPRFLPDLGEGQRPGWGAR